MRGIGRRKAKKYSFGKKLLYYAALLADGAS